MQSSAQKGRLLLSGMLHQSAQRAAIDIWYIGVFAGAGDRTNEKLTGGWLEIQPMKWVTETLPTEEYHVAQNSDFASDCRIPCCTTICFRHDDGSFRFCRG